MYEGFEEWETYGPIDLKKQFPELESINDLVLAPLIQVIASKFFDWFNQHLPEFNGELNYTDAAILESGIDSWHLCHRTWIMVIKGKLIQMMFFRKDIDADENDDDETWFVIGEIKFSSRMKNKLLCEEFKGLIKEFVATQNLDELKEAAKEILDKGKRTHTSRQMVHFYKLQQHI
jgi:hypothetical protein